MRKIIVILIYSVLQFSCSSTQESQRPDLAKKILEDERLDVVMEKAKKNLTSKSGDFNAGSHQPHGAKSFLGAAGALGKAIQLIKQEAENQLK